jgi:DNA-binding transcriptional ArsR family regulator
MPDERLDKICCQDFHGPVPDVEVIGEPTVAAVALDPVRARLLAELREPASAATLAARVGLSRQKVNYHLRQLEAHGLVRMAGTRRWGGLTERLLVATARGYVVSPDALGEAAGDQRPTPDRLSTAYVIALAARVVREVGGMARRAASADRRVPVFGLDTAIRFRSPAERAVFAEDLTAAITGLVSRYHDVEAPDGRWQRLVVTAYPVPKGMEPDAPTEHPVAAQLPEHPHPDAPAQPRRETT